MLVDRAGRGTDRDAVAAIVKPPAEVRLLEVHPEALVETPDLVERLGARQHHGARDGVDTRVARQGAIRVVEPPDPSIARRCGVNPEHLAERHPERGEALGRGLRGAVRIGEGGPDEAALAVGVEEAPERHEALGLEHDVGVHRADVRRPLRGRRPVDGRAVSGIVGVHQHRHVGVRFPHGLRGAVRAVVGDDDARVEPGDRLAGRRDRLERELARVVADDDHGQVDHVCGRRTATFTSVPSSARSGGAVSPREPG